jgi:hypothetical protein
LLLHTLAQPLTDVQVGRGSRSVQQRDAERVSHRLDERPTVVARMVQAQGDRHLQTEGVQLPQYLTATLSMDGRAVSDGAHHMRESRERASPLETWPPAGRFEPTPGQAPKSPQKRAEDPMRRLYQKDGTLTRLGCGSARRPRFFATLPAPRGRLWLAGSRPGDGGARGA